MADFKYGPTRPSNRVRKSKSRGVLTWVNTIELFKCTALTHSKLSHSKASARASRRIMLISTVHEFGTAARKEFERKTSRSAAFLTTGAGWLDQAGPDC
jgi:hypothetical protein